MLNEITQKPLKVSGRDGFMLDLPVSQLEEVRRVLDLHSIRYWPGENHYSFDNGPWTTYIKFSLNEDPDKVQAILDAAE